MTKFIFKAGFVSLTLKGTNTATLLNLLNKHGIPLKSLKKLDSTTFVVKVKAKHYQNLVAILNQKCYNVVEQKSSFSWLAKTFKHTGILAGLVLGVLLNIFASFFVCKIELLGDENFKPQILKALNQNGVCVSCLKSNLNFKTLKQNLYESVDNLSLISFSLRGSTLLVHYTTRTANPAQDEEQTNIIAKNSGIVSSIVVTSGTALVKQGDLVQKGDVLIAGYTTQDGKAVQTQAKGQVFAYTFKSATLKFPLEKIEYGRTGNFVQRFKVTYLNQTLFETQNKNPFKNFETETKELFLSTTSVPLKICYTTFFELSPVLVTQNFEENKQKLLAQAKLLAYEQILGDEEILDEKAETNFVSNIWFVSYYIKIKEKISWNLI